MQFVCGWEFIIKKPKIQLLHHLCITCDVFKLVLDGFQKFITKGLIF